MSPVVTGGAAVAERLRVLVEVVDPDAPQIGVVLSGAMQLFGPADPVDVVLFVSGVEEPDVRIGALLQELCLRTQLEGSPLPETVLLGESGATATPAVAHVRASADDAENARAIALLTGVAQSLWQEPAATPTPVEDDGAAALVPLLEARLARSQAQTAIARHDARAATAVQRGDRRPHVAVLFQHRSYWNAVVTVVEALTAAEDVEVTLVAVDSDADGRDASTADFLVERGYRPRSAQWLTRNLSDVDVVVMDNPYDEMRPEDLSATALAAAGVRLVALPYGMSAIDGTFMTRLLWDLPLQRLAWRAYLPTEQLREAYARHCAAGAEPVRVLGSAKLDRIVAPARSTLGVALRRTARKRPIVLWNPHFRLGTGGWSTFDVYLEPLLQHAMAHPDLVLLIRPHFRLFRDLRLAGGSAADVEQTLRAVCARHENIVLDDSPDYVDALTACDAMLSDLSSLATELLPTGKPILYLHREGGPGPSGAGAYFDAMDRATGWPDVERFLDQVRRGEDPSRQRRLAAAEQHLGPADGHAGERIAADLIASLRSELALEAARESTAATVEVLATGVAAAGVRLDLRAPAGAYVVRLSSGQDASEPVAYRGGTAQVTVPLTRRHDDEQLPLPCGRYRLQVSTTDGRAATVDIALGAWRSLSRQLARDERVRVSLVAAGTEALEVVLRPPVERDGRRETTLMRATYPAALRHGIEHAVLFTAYNGIAAACNPLALDRELAARGHDARRYWVVEDFSVAVPAGAVPVLRGSKEHYERLGSARWLVDNEGMPAFLQKRPGQTLVQTWHGTPLKRLRWDLHEVSPRDREFMRYCDRDAGQWDVTLSPNPYSTEILRRGFRVTGEVAELGYPRNDVLAEPVSAAAARDRARSRLGISGTGSVVLYAPTWRDDALVATADGSHSYGARWAAQPTLDFGAVVEALGPDTTVLYRGHRFVAVGAERVVDPHVRDVSGYPDMADLLAAADVLVTDYSSCMFDFALTGRPMLFFAYDLERYRDQVRGFYLDMEAVVPGPVLRTADAVTAALTELPTQQQRYAERYAAFVERFAPWDDGHAAARVVDRVFSSS